jgi:ParB/RepB/Spo0J family partition protein
MVTELRIDEIIANPNQPRKHFDEEALNELAASIIADGLQEPILVRPKEDKYEIVQGERRYRAHIIAGLETIQAKVKELSDDDAFHLAVIENIQREQLTPIEEAQAFLRYSEMGYTHEEIAKKVNKSRTFVTTRLRLLKLLPELQEWIARGKITEGHAKQLLAVENALGRLIGHAKSYESIQVKFIVEHERKTKVSVNDVKEWGDSYREYLLWSIIGVFNGHGETIVGSYEIASVPFEMTMKRVCDLYDLCISAITMDDAEFLLDRLQKTAPEGTKKSLIYQTYEKVEEIIQMPDEEKLQIWRERGMDKPLRDKTLEEITADVLKHKAVPEDEAEKRGLTLEDLLRDFDTILKDM